MERTRRSRPEYDIFTADILRHEFVESEAKARLAEACIDNNLHVHRFYTQTEQEIMCVLNLSTQYPMVFFTLLVADIVHDSGIAVDGMITSRKLNTYLPFICRVIYDYILVLTVEKPDILEEQGFNSYESFYGNISWRFNNVFHSDRRESLHWTGVVERVFASYYDLDTERTASTRASIVTKSGDACHTDDTDDVCKIFNMDKSEMFVTLATITDNGWTNMRADYDYCNETRIQYARLPFVSHINIFGIRFLRMVISHVSGTARWVVNTRGADFWCERHKLSKSHYKSVFNTAYETYINSGSTVGLNANLLNYWCTLYMMDFNQILYVQGMNRITSLNVNIFTKDTIFGISGLLVGVPTFRNTFNGRQRVLTRQVPKGGAPTPSYSTKNGIDDIFRLVP